SRVGLATCGRSLTGPKLQENHSDNSLVGAFTRGVAMIKSELVQTIANRNPHLFLRDVENIVNAIFEEITDALAEGNRVELRGFGAFSVKNRPERVSRNPRTVESVQVEEKWIPFFKTGKELRERLNGGK